jgi:glutamyl-tRNA synthetase
MEKRFITRFAPSPTGTLHVGGARTAIFNFLFSRKFAGIFRLRIENTDRTRSSSKMTKKIIEGLKWLGVTYDSEIVFQADNLERHQQLALELVHKQYAYRCFCGKEVLEQKRKKAQSSNQAYRYDGECRNLSPSQIDKKLANKEPYIIRFRIPEGETQWSDGVRGQILINNQEIDDFVILREDRSPTYNLSVVADDFDMGITHVFRGEDHISNTPKQILIYQACGWDIPEFYHLPLILGQNKKRLSKRHGSVSVLDYQKIGILPEALFNYLTLLGWTAAEGKEIFTREELIHHFSIEEINKKSAIFDETKLRWINRQHISRKTVEELLPDVIQLWKEKGWLETQKEQVNPEKIKRIISLLKVRVENMKDFGDAACYFFQDPDSYEEKGIRQHLSNPEVWDWLSNLTIVIKEAAEYHEVEAERIVRKFAENAGVSAAKIIHPLRLALCGVTASPGIFELMEIFGRETVIRRIGRFIEKTQHLQKNINNS